jgi:hypothetical protein
MIVAVAGIVMLVVSLGLFPGTGLLTAVRAGIRWIEACDKEDTGEKA